MMLQGISYMVATFDLVAYNLVTIHLYSQKHVLVLQF